jgi:hypothetical protein
MKAYLRILIPLFAIVALSFGAWSFASAREEGMKVVEMERPGTVKTLEREVENQKAASASTGNSTTASSSTTVSGSSTNDNGSGPEDPSETELVGTLQAINGDVYTIDGVQVHVTTETEVEDPLHVGDLVKAHVYTAADGSLVAREIELANADDHENDDDAAGEIEDQGDDHGGQFEGHHDSGHSDAGHHGGEYNQGSDD